MLCGSDIFLRDRATFYTLGSLWRHTVTSGHSHGELMNLGLPPDCTSLAAEYICSDPTGAQSVFMQQSYFAAKLFDAKEKLFFVEQSHILKMVQMGSVQVSLTWPGWNTWILILWRWYHRPETSLLASLIFESWSAAVHLILCLWLSWHSHQAFMHSLTKIQASTCPFFLSQDPHSETCFLIIC